MKPRHYSAWLAAACLVAPVSLAPAADNEAGVDFARDIQPIFLKTCIECHGPEKQKGKLRLDSKDEAFKEETVIVAGKADESELYTRIILPAGHDDIMPAKGDPLSKEQTELIKKWINLGASWPDGLVIKMPEDPNAEKDPREPVQPSPAEQKAIAQLAELGVQVRPVAMNVTWTQSNFRGIDPANVSKAMALLADIQTLEDLNVAGVGIKDDDLKPLSKLVNLTRLHLEKTPVTDAGLEHLKGLVNLRYLNLYDTQVTDAGLAHLHGLARLKNLYLWQTKITDDGAKQLEAALPKTDVNRGFELSALAAQIEENKKKEAEEKAKAEAEKKKKEEEEAKAKAEADQKKKEAEEAKKKEEAAAEKKDDKPKDETKPEEKKDN